MTIDDCKELEVNITISDEAIDELLGNTNIKTQDDLFGKDGILKQLSKRLMEKIA